ncbi:MAG: O-antigen ligase family protein [Schaedlerella sp.]|nr:O-antigen ligase family protein [Schaedlerella sp.]
MKVIVNRLDIVSLFFTIIILGLTIIKAPWNLGLFAAYAMISLLFISSIEHLIAIMTIMATIAYYFVGADEGVFSIYSIFIILVVIRNIMSHDYRFKGKIRFLFYKVILCLIAYLSYTYSPIGYFNGFTNMIYIIVLSIVLANFVDLNIEKLCKIMAYIACIVVVGFFIMLVASGVLQEGRFSISDAVNANTFGMSCAQIGIVLFLSFFLEKFNKKRRRLYIIFFCLDCVLILMSGSRTAFFAMFASIAIAMFIMSVRDDKLSRRARRLIILGITLMIVAAFALSDVGIDLSRYNYIELIKGGGTNRFSIFAAIIPFVIVMGYWKFGYGPGHECSRIIVSKLVGREYTHTHNLFIEAFAELGVGGLLFFIIILFGAFANALKMSKINVYRLIPLAMLIGLSINGLGESYFCDAYLWILIGLCEQVDSGSNKYAIDE